MVDAPRQTPDSRTATDRRSVALPGAWVDAVVRLAVVLAIGGTLALTWPLWQGRETPPLVPLLLVPAFPMGIVLAVSALVGLIWPRVGWAVYVAALVVAVAQDQSRLQPQMISFALLLLATLPAAGARLVGRSHLAALWFFSGFHKLLSAEYFADFVPRMFGPLLPEAGPTTLAWLGTGLAWLEITLGLLALSRQGGRVAGVVGAALHLGILFGLWQLGWNTSVWPWNGAIAVAAPLLLWRTDDAWEPLWTAASRPARAVALFVLLSPLGYYVGLVDAYLAHCLYSANTPQAYIGPSEEPQPGLTHALWDTLNVPLPPAERIFLGYFRAVGQPGQLLVIEDPRPWNLVSGPASPRKYVWPGVRLPDAPPTAEPQ